METEIKSFTTLMCWQKASLLKQEVFVVIKKIEKKSEWDLSRQLKRSVISITANIAEGYGRFHYQETMQYFRQSRGSLYETYDHLISCFNLGHLSSDELNHFKELCDEASRLINGYIKYLQKQKKPQTTRH